MRSVCDIISDFRQMKRLISSQPGLTLITRVFLSSPPETEVKVAEAVVVKRMGHMWRHNALRINLSIGRPNSGGCQRYTRKFLRVFLPRIPRGLMCDPACEQMSDR